MSLLTPIDFKNIGTPYDNNNTLSEGLLGFYTPYKVVNLKYLIDIKYVDNHYLVSSTLINLYKSLMYYVYESSFLNVLFITPSLKAQLGYTINDIIYTIQKYFKNDVVIYYGSENDRQTFINNVIKNLKYSDMILETVSYLVDNPDEIDELEIITDGDIENLLFKDIDISESKILNTIRKFLAKYHVIDADQLIDDSFNIVTPYISFRYISMNKVFSAISHAVKRNYDFMQTLYASIYDYVSTFQVVIKPNYNIFDAPMNKFVGTFMDNLILFYLYYYMADPASHEYFMKTLNFDMVLDNYALAAKSDIMMKIHNVMSSMISDNLYAFIKHRYSIIGSKQNNNSKIVPLNSVFTLLADDNISLDW